MRVVILKKPLRQLLLWGQRVLLAGAVALLAYCGFVLVDAWVFQKAEQRQLEQLLADRHLTDRQSANGKTLQTTSPIRTGPLPDGRGSVSSMIGRLEIPRLGLSAMVLEGISRTTLRRAVGHIPGTALPGEPGNVGISGHRDTFFRPLRKVQQNDIITVTTPAGEYRYRVVSTRVVHPNDVSVLDPIETEILTLITCYPFYFVGSAPERFIVRAERVT